MICYLLEDPHNYYIVFKINNNNYNKILVKVLQLQATFPLSGLRGMARIVSPVDSAYVSDDKESFLRI